MKCPFCKDNFIPQMTALITLKDDYKTKKQYQFFAQLCPGCFQPIIGVDEKESGAFNTGTPINQNELKLYTPQ
jgi:hypothetical protein